MWVYLDDERPTPPSFSHRVYWPDEAIELLKTGQVEVISLDHDLGNDARGTGYDVILWIEEAVSTSDFVPPKHIFAHTANESAEIKMKMGIRAIRKIVEDRE